MSKNSRRFFWLSMIAAFILIALNLVLIVVLKMGAFGKLLAPLAANVAVFFYLLLKRRFYFSVRINWDQFIVMIKFCFPLTIGAMLGYFTNGFDKTALESLGDVTEYGYYCVGSSIAAYLMSFSSAVNSTFQPDIYESIASSNRKKLLKTAAIQISIILFVVLLFIVFCPIIIRLLTAGRYMQSIQYSRIIAVSTVTSSVYYLINNYTIAKGFPQLYLCTMLLGSISIVVFMPWAISFYKYVGGAWMVSVSYLLLTIVNVIFLLCVKNKEKK